MTMPFEVEEPEAAELTPEQLAALEAPPALPPLHCFPLRVEWERQKPAEVSGHPAPAVIGCWGTEVPELCPEPVLKLAELAREAGWEVRFSYARGNGVHGATGRPTAVRHNIAVSFGRHPMTDAQAVATYVKAAAGSGTWSWESVWLWGPALPHFGLCGLAELKHWLTQETPEQWYAEVRWRVAEMDAAGVEQAEARKQLKAMKAEGMSVEAICTELGLELDREEVERVLKPPKAKSEGN
jgi:hypothetical protein